MTRGVRVKSAATAAGRADRRPLLPGRRAAVSPADAAADAVGGAHRHLGAAFRIRSGTGIEAAEYADGVVATTLTRAMEFGYPPATRSIGVPFKPWGPAPCLPLPAVELRDRPLTVAEAWGRPAVADLRDRLATAAGPYGMLMLLEDELMRRVGETTGLGLVRRTSGVLREHPGHALDVGPLPAD